VAEQHPEKVKELMDLMKSARVNSAVFPFQVPTFVK